MESLYEVYELIGEGSFGKVYRARCRQSHVQLAYKVISKSGRGFLEVAALREECRIQKNLRHPNIIRMLNSFENENELVVVTEFAQKDLCHILKEEGVLDENGARKIIHDLISALHYLHSNRVLHRDLKPQNVLLDSNGNAKLCDFGFAKVLGKDSQMLTSIKGTPLYMAPELMHELPYDQNADLWSLGCIAYELVTGHPPYTTSSILQLVKMIKVEPIKWPDYLSETCLSLLKGLLQKNPVSRLSWPNLLHHPFISVHVMSQPPVIPAQPERHMSPAPPGMFFPIPQTTSSASASNSRITFNQLGCDNSIKFVPSHTIEITDESVRTSNTSALSRSSQKKSGSAAIDPTVSAQNEEWLEFLKKTISSIMYDRDVDVLVDQHSLMLIIKTFDNYSSCPIIVTTVARLLSLPFVVELISETHQAHIRQMYVYCGVMNRLLSAVKRIVMQSCEKKLESPHEVALQHLLLLICNLTYTDQNLLLQFFHICISLNLFKIIKNLLSIRTKDDPFSVVKYVISVFLRLYVVIPQSRQYITIAFQDCISEFHMLLQQYEDMTVHLRVCTFITVLSCTKPYFLQKSPAINTLIRDLTQLKNNFNVPSAQQVTSGTLQVLKNLECQQ